MELMWEKAIELGRLIGQTPECKAMRRAEASLREDQDSMRRLETIQGLARKMEQLLAGGQEPDEVTAQVLGCRQATVRSHIHRGLETLRAELGEWVP